MLLISHESGQTEDSHVSEIFFLYFINNLYICTNDSRQTADRNIDCVSFFYLVSNLYLQLY
jgi:hypothetical protein